MTNLALKTNFCGITLRCTTLWVDLDEFSLLESDEEFLELWDDEELDDDEYEIHNLEG